MKIESSSPDEYVAQLPDDRKLAIQKLREIVLKKIPKGFEETMSYGMIGYVVPHSLYPAGYHVDPKLPLPFMNIASQKNFIAVYHMGMYANPEIYHWFVTEYPKHCTTKPDLGKSCIRFKRSNDIPVELIGELAAKITVDEWIHLYETNLKR